MVKTIMSPAPKMMSENEEARKKEEVLLLWRDLSMELVMMDVGSVREKLDGLS
jgi:hypothetical protein